MRSSLRHTPTLLRHARAVRPSCWAPMASAVQSPSLGAPALAPASARASSSSSVNPSEISHFNALAATWWDPHGSSRILHLMNPLRHDFISTCRASSPTVTSSTPTGQLRYLDVGCGGGIFAESAARLPSTASVTAIDPSPGVLAVARSHAARDPGLTAEKLEYISATIETLPPRERSKDFDVVTLFEVIEHVDHPAAFIDRCGEFVKPGGWLVMSTIARTWTSWFTTNLMAEDILGVVPKGTHDWRKYINEDELRAHFRGKGGWSSPRVLGVVYIPGLGWKEVKGSEKIGNYFFALQRDA
ncbi:hexaprenyldihydroxybenzoate methyltransferase [Lasiosphaeris hirsuta]|uniref:Ubiquinone biosynthesis O-methyltransferase, mitochondrial n=1 Tax=Lasiosphaeris hirsuta TaxID=260670 RepID=A0AA40A1W6_9PEZI|nr:hexaprenyldihydroxybenzoate methyltransferase [Lasiosphaeris hirsuta]